MATPEEVRAYITGAAERRGIPAWLAVAVAWAESGGNFDARGDWWVDALNYPAGTPIIARTPGGFLVPSGTKGARPTSFGPFQLRAGRAVTGLASEAGLGDGAVASGIDVTDPSQWKRGVDYALDYAASRGTFAGTWSVAVGQLGQAFAGAVKPGSEKPTETTAPTPFTPGMPQPGEPLGPSPIPAKPFTGPEPLSGFADSFGGIAAAIGALPAAIAKPFVDQANAAYAFLSWLGQSNIWLRIGLIVLGAVLIVVGLVMFAASFMPREAVQAVAKAV